MSIKDLFGKRSNKIVTKQQAEKLADEVESLDLIKHNNTTNHKLVPRVDYSSAKNFARYGSAEKYYEDSFNYIYKTYPYDGSTAEKLKWKNEASGLDNYLLEKQYPTSVGHVFLKGAGMRTKHVDAGGNYYSSAIPQYITIKGGPNKDPSVKEGSEYELSRQFPAKGGNANIWDEDMFRESNLGINPSIGNTVEFWTKLDTDSISSGEALCFFDLWNGQPHSSSKYMRFLIESLPSSGSDFSVTYKFGAAAEGASRVGVSLTAATKATLGASWRTNWQHYSFSVAATASGIVVKLYVNGAYEATVTAGNNITSTVPQENYVANINALRTKPLATSPDLVEGSGGGNGIYFDEFRFWKSSRTAKDVGRNWFTSVSGGTNTDESKHDTVDLVDLGVYYKFNEGLLNTTGISAQDQGVLDYSGRISNGTIQNYSLSVRKLTSAMDESSLIVEHTESPDPIMYPTHPSVSALKAKLILEGSAWDMENNASFYHTMPEWILEEDQEGQTAKQLVQTLSSYLDSVHAQIETLVEIKDNKYFDLSDTQSKPFFFAKNLLRSVGFDVSDIFTEASALEEISSRGEKELFDNRIQDIKNVIYQNIYNNISYIYKTKGTEKSFRNLIRCFGVDDELIKLNLYADGVDYTLDGRYSYSALKKNYVDFNHVDREEGCVYSRDVASHADVREYIAGMTTAQSAQLSITLTAEVLFPRQLEKEQPAYNAKDFTTVSLFGVKEANLSGGGTEVYDDSGLSNIGRFQVQAIKPDTNSLHAKFKLIYTDADGDHELVTDEYKDVYDNSKWNFAVRLKPLDADLGDYVSGGATIEDYKLEFYGVQMSLDVVEEEFTKSVTYSGANVAKARAMIASPKIAYCGHYRQDYDNVSTGTVKTDVKITDLMYWFDYLSDEEIKIHGKDIGNVGRLYPNDDAYGFFTQLSSGGRADAAIPDIRVPRKDTLALHWDFTNVTTSDASSQFIVNDISQGGADYISTARYGWFTTLVGYRHQGIGSFNAALPNDTQVINREYQYTAKHRLPEVLSGDDMVEIRTQDDNVFTKDSRPINHFWAIEKSMSQVISEEMINFFASIVEFNDLIGRPVHRYRMEYKTLEKFRSLFYERVDNSPSFEKYVEFYKWLDSSLGLMMQQLIPASGNFSDSMRNMVESHILERNKYWTKFPTLEMKQDPPEGTLRGIRELTYDWEHGHAPVGRYNKKSISLDGTNDHVLLVDDDAFSFTDGSSDKPFTISAWVYVGDISTDNGPFVTKSNFLVATSNEYLFKHENGQLKLHIYDSALNAAGNQLHAFASSATLTSKKWHHVVATYDGSETHAGMKMYTDGVLTASTTQESGTYVNMRNTSSPLIFGATVDGAANSTANRVFEDKLADIALFNKALTADEIKELYNSGEVYNIKLHSASSNIISWYKMGDGEDAIGAGGIKDYVGTRHGTLTNGAAIVDEAELPSVLDYDESEHGLWRAERAERTVVDATESDNIDNDREKIRKTTIRDILGQNKMVPVGTDGFIEEGEPTLYDKATGKNYEGSTYATRRLSRPYKLNLAQQRSIKGGPNFANATPASPNDMIRAATHLTSKIELSRLFDDSETCRDEYAITGGPKDKKRRAHIVTITDLSSAQTEVKGSLFTPPFYGAHPNDANAVQTNTAHDSYGLDHEIPMQGVFSDEWVGGNQHRHIDLNTGADAEANRPELYVEGGGSLVNPFAKSTDGPSARYTRDGMAKRPLNIANINTAINKDNHGSYDGTPKLGNYTRDYEIVQTSGRSVNNRWVVKDEGKYEFTGSASPYVAGPTNSNTRLYDFELPDRTKNSAGASFGRTEHVFVERFSAPGDAATLSRGALDIQAEEFSPYNSLNYRNMRVRNHLNFWHKEHTKQFGFRDDYIHGTYDDFIDLDGDGSFDAGESNDFGGNTPDVAAWHKNNRNPRTRMYLHNATTVEAEKSYDNFFIGHQIPRSDWQYSWVTSSALHFEPVTLGGRNPKFDDENVDHQAVSDPTNFWKDGSNNGFNHDADGATPGITTHPRYSGYTTGYSNATVSLSLLSSSQFAVTINSGSTSTDYSLQVDFAYGNYVFAQPVDWDKNLLGSCGDCSRLFRDFPEFDGKSKMKAGGPSELNAILLNRNGPYQAAGWKFLRNNENPIVRSQRSKNTISVQKEPSKKTYNMVTPATPGLARIVVNKVPTQPFTIHFPSPSVGWTAMTVTAPELAQFNRPHAVANKIKELINAQSDLRDKNKIIAESKPGANWVDIKTFDTGIGMDNYKVSIQLNAADRVDDADGNPTKFSAVVIEAPVDIKNGTRIFVPDTETKAQAKLTIKAATTKASLNGYKFILIDANHSKQTFIFNSLTASTAGGTVGLLNANDILTIITRIKTAINAVTSIKITAGAVATSPTASAATDTHHLMLSQDTAGDSGIAYVDYDPAVMRVEKFSRTLQHVEISGLAFVSKFVNGSDEKVSTFEYKDRRSDSHEKFVEPPAGWNMPMVHIISEKNDNLGTKVTHSYSNNLGMFANPKLLRRTSGGIKSTEQFYDKLFERYSPTEKETSTLDFVRLEYREYIFPKQRNVGLTKTRNRVNWGAVSRAEVGAIPTGNLVSFWKDNPIDRVKGALGPGAVNAIGYSNSITEPYLFNSDPSGWMKLGPYEDYKQREWMTARSIFGMDNFEVLNLKASKDDGKWHLWTVLGDLQYVGLPTYLSWIINKNCNSSTNVENVFLNNAVASDYFDQITIEEQARLAKTLTRTYVDPSEVPPPGELGSTTATTESALIGDLQGVVYSPDDARRAVLLDNWMVQEGIKSEAGVSESDINNAAAVLKVKRKFVDSLCMAPTPSIQYYYLPWDSAKPESAWEYRTASLAGKNPWYNSYKDFNLETRALAQNYGLLAEFKISEHMDKYLREEQGNFRATNYDFLTLEGASYESVNPIESFGNPASPKYPDTKTSGKATLVGQQAFFSIDGTEKNKITAIPHIDEKDLLPNMAVRNNSVEEQEMFKNWSLLKNNAGISEDFEITNKRPTHFSKAEVTDYRTWDKIMTEFGDSNSIYAGGKLTIDNSTITSFPKGGKIEETTPFTEKNSWADSLTIDDGTGRNKYHALGDFLPEDIAKAFYVGADSNSDSNFGYENGTEDGAHPQITWAPTTGVATTYKFPFEKPLNYQNYRESEQFKKWISHRPSNYGLPAALRLNRGDSTDEYLHGDIDFIDRTTTTAWWDTPVRKLDPFSYIEDKIVADGGLIPLIKNVPYRSVATDPAHGMFSGDSDNPGVTWETLFKKVERKELKGGTPTTISIWAKPEFKENCADITEPVGLYVFGRYFQNKTKMPVTKRAQWRERNVPVDSFGVCSNYPAPPSLESAYPNGMGVTFFMIGDNSGEDIGTIFAGGKNKSMADEEAYYRHKNVYHFFSKTGSVYSPAVLTAEEWNSVILQMMPQTSITVPRVKLILNGKVLYGIHRSALLDVNSGKRAYASCPIGRRHPVDLASPWGNIDKGLQIVQSEVNGSGATVALAKQHQRLQPADSYKLGKSVFYDIEDNSTLGASQSYCYFKGDLMEFSLWSGILSEADITRIQDNPVNLQELSLNGEVLGGYTDISKFQQEWGSTSSFETIPEPYATSTSGTPAIWTRSTPYISIEATRSRKWLAIWHRLGVRPYVAGGELCHDWDDEFFNSYVHTDTIQFFDAIVEDHDSVSDDIRKRVKIKVNALKKFMPYRGFYPQDRTMQLAKLFQEKMATSINGVDSSEAHPATSMQAALQPFFAPGILYNSIKAGVAVDWPIFTNETGMEPYAPGTTVELPYAREDLGDAYVLEVGFQNKMTISSLAPRWYAPRSDPFDVQEGLMVADYIKQSSDEVILSNLMAETHDLKKQKNKGFLIREEPTARIPFEGLVALDSVLPSANSQESEFAQQFSQKRAFKYMDVEISGWDSEGCTLTMWQPEPTTSTSTAPGEDTLETDAARGRQAHLYNESNHPETEGAMRDGWRLAKKVITIAHGNTTLKGYGATNDDGDAYIGFDPAERGSSASDVLVDFQRKPQGFVLPSVHQSATAPVDPTEITLDSLNEEIAVKLCRAINKRDDIHWIAIPGLLYEWQYVSEQFLQIEAGRSDEVLAEPDGGLGGLDTTIVNIGEAKYTDDHIARLFPASAPELFGANIDDITDYVGDRPEGASIYHNQYKYSQFFNDESTAAWSQGQTGSPQIGRQGNGTWKVRLIYVGLPKKELSRTATSSSSIIDDTKYKATWNRKTVPQINRLGRRPSAFSWTDTFTDWMPLGWKELHVMDPERRDLSELGLNDAQAAIDDAGDIFDVDDLDLDEEIREARSQIRDETPGTPQIPGMRFSVGLDEGEEGSAFPRRMMFEYRGPEKKGYALQYSNWSDNTGKPTHQFQGGSAPAMTSRPMISLCDLASVEVSRTNLSTNISRWVDGWGWLGIPKFTSNDELGLKLSTPDGSTIKTRTYSPTVNTQPVTNKNSYNLAWLADIENSSIKSEQTPSHSLIETTALHQGPYPLHGGTVDVTPIRVTPKPHQIYLMTPEYYIGNHKLEAQPHMQGGPSNDSWAANHWNYSYPYFEYTGNNGDERLELAMNNFLAEVPNFFLKDNKLISFSSKPETEFKMMEAGKTYFMDVTMYQSEKFFMVASPYSTLDNLGSPSYSSNTRRGVTYEGSYFGPAFDAGDDHTYRADPCQAPYVPPYLYGKSVARISFYADETKKYTLEEIFSRVTVTNIASELARRLSARAGSSTRVDTDVLTKPAYTARTTLSASMNLFGKSSVKQVEYSAQVDRLRDNLDSALQRFVPQTATDPNGSNRDVWVIGTKFESPVLNFYNSDSFASMVTAIVEKSAPFASTPASVSEKGLTRRPTPTPLKAAKSYNMAEYRPSGTEVSSPGSDHKIPAAVDASEQYGLVARDDDFRRGTGLWASYGRIPNENDGIFVTVEETLKQREDFSTPKGVSVGSLIDVCGFTPEKQKVGEIAAEKEISEAVVMIPFVDKPSETTAETIVIDGRNFFKINKDLFDLQKANVENGKGAVLAGEYEGVTQDIPETSISKMIKSMKKYNLPPKFDFVRYPMKSSEHPFVMYIFEFHHKLSSQDLADIWQGLPPDLATSAEYDSSTFTHDLSKVDFFEENTLPSNVRWMTFKVKKQAKDNYFETTSTGNVGDERFKFDFELGKNKVKYNYNWPYDFFTMLEMVQVEAGVDIVENKNIIIPQVVSTQGNIKSSDLQRQIGAVKEQSQVDTPGAKQSWGSALTSDTGDE